MRPRIGLSRAVRLWKERGRRRSAALLLLLTFVGAGTVRAPSALRAATGEPGPMVLER